MMPFHYTPSVPGASGEKARASLRRYIARATVDGARTWKPGYYKRSSPSVSPKL
jgi:hypothetical protein